MVDGVTTHAAASSQPMSRSERRMSVGGPPQIAYDPEQKLPPAWAEPPPANALVTIRNHPLTKRYNVIGSNEEECDIVIPELEAKHFVVAYHRSSKAYIRAVDGPLTIRKHVDEERVGTEFTSEFYDELDDYPLTVLAGSTELEIEGDFKDMKTILGTSTKKRRLTMEPGDYALAAMKAMEEKDLIESPSVNDIQNNGALRVRMSLCSEEPHVDGDEEDDEAELIISPLKKVRVDPGVLKRKREERESESELAKKKRRRSSVSFGFVENIEEQE